MAEAVEGAAVVLPCLTEKYKASVNCLKELNYTDQHNRAMVPLILEQDWDRAALLSGPVGLITSNLIYVDFSAHHAALSAENSNRCGVQREEALDQLFEQLEHALEGRGRAMPQH
jgi:hypothetical protein